MAFAAVADAHRRGVALPEGWALDAEGRPTTDAAAGLAGSLVPIGGYKGSGLALMVDVLAGGLGGSHFSSEMSSFGDCEGGPPRSGQFLLAIDPVAFGGAGFTAHVEAMLTAMLAEPGVRLPGDRRLAARAAHAGGIAVSAALVSMLEGYARDGSPASHR